MKKILFVISEVKTSACLCFSAWVTVWAMLSLLFWPGATLRAGQVLGMLAASLWAACLQWLCFIYEKGQRYSYVVRVALFAAGFYPALAACAWFQKWFPAGNVAAWVGFTALFFLLLVLVTIGFEVLFSVQGKRYAGLLGEYHRKKQAREQ